MHFDFPNPHTLVTSFTRNPLDPQSKMGPFEMLNFIRLPWPTIATHSTEILFLDDTVALSPFSETSGIFKAKENSPWNGFINKWEIKKEKKAERGRQQKWNFAHIQLISRWDLGNVPIMNGRINTNQTTLGRRPKKRKLNWWDGFTLDSDPTRKAGCEKRFAAQRPPRALMFQQAPRRPTLLLPYEINNITPI